MSDELAYFGYGSLVNELTWARPYNMQPAELRNWAREWGHCVDTPFGPLEEPPYGRICALTANRDANSRVQGVFIRSTFTEISHIDEREIGYSREKITRPDVLETDIFLPTELYIYESKADFHRPASMEYPLWLSYVDCVLVGYLNVFGEGGVDRFIESTQGWSSPILDDRSQPLYPRAVRLSPEDRRFIDGKLTQISGLRFFSF